MWKIATSIQAPYPADQLCLTATNAASEFTAATVPFSIRTMLDRDLGGSFNLFSQTQIKQLMVHIRVAAYTVANRPIPDMLIQCVKKL